MPPKGGGSRRLSPIHIVIVLAFFVIGFWLGSPMPTQSLGASTGGSKLHTLSEQLKQKREAAAGAGAVPTAAPAAPVIAMDKLQAPDAADRASPKQASVREDFGAGKQQLDAESEHRKMDSGVSSPGRGIQCPVINGEVDGGLIPLAHLPRKKKTTVAQKYDRRAHNCASHGIWNRVTIDDHHKILHDIVRLGKIKRNSFVLDWGSGCGHSMQFLYDEYNTTGVGIDVSSLTIAYSRENTTKANLYCVADGTKMEWLPTEAFDNAFSFGSIYHVYNRTMFCHVLRQLTRLVKVGGTVYNGWTENAEYKRDHVQPCLEDLSVSFQIHEEAHEFADVKIFPLKSQQRAPNTYSLVITKTGPVTAEEVTWESVPIVCGKHKCVKKTSPEANEPLP